ncbi:MAG: hypothetical protein IJT66_02610 [Clostridia bacterium]|nr:hypothetical protein [Clostridia bacterium]
MPTFTNIASLGYNGGTIYSNMVTGELAQEVVATKTAVTNTYQQGDILTYVIRITNTCDQALSDLTVTDNLGAYSFDTSTLYPLTYVENSLQYYVNGEPQESPTVVAGPPLSVSGISIPVGGNAIILYQARANEYAPLSDGESIINEAVITGHCAAAAITVSETVAPVSETSLTITKALDPAVVSENEPITYTFTIQNTGTAAATAADELVLNDAFNPVLSGLTVTYNGTVWESPANYTYDTVTGEFSTVAGQITVPAATVSQNDDGIYVLTPGVSTLVVTGIMGSNSEKT